MKVLKCESPKVYASYQEDNFICGSEICLPDKADITIWKLFDSEEKAREYYKVPIEE